MFSAINFQRFRIILEYQGKLERIWKNLGICSLQINNWWMYNLFIETLLSSLVNFVILLNWDKYWFKLSQKYESGCKFVNHDGKKSKVNQESLFLFKTITEEFSFFFFGDACLIFYNNKTTDVSLPSFYLSF